ncbi:hypothetical protein ACFV2Q_26750 [Streptomyces sp. NPDC059650]|uniref:hypothetical protein n=1 Tax=unclassified Streptomyces TaxID=2593676 RepID=UPI0033EE4635
MPLSQTRAPRSHRARSTRRRADAAAAAGRRALRRPLMLSAAGGLHPAALAAVALAVLLLLGVAARAGGLTNLWDFLDFGAGVLSLVSLTSAVLWGLAATDRLLFTSGLRIVAQGVHRGLAVSGLGFLALHIWIKIAESRTSAVNALIPFTDEEQPVLIGLGSLAGYLFVSVAVSGAVRSAFATKGRSLWWRALHVGAYPAWGASLVHGLQSGRVAAGWVTVAYGMCLVGVAGVLLIRLRRRLRAERDKPAAAQPQAAPRSAGPDRPRSNDGFLRRPAEWAAERLTARIARQTDGSPGGPPTRPLAEQPADPYAGTFADPVADPLLASATAQGVPSQRPPLRPVPAAPPYGEASTFGTRRFDVSTDRPGGRPAGGGRRRS